MKKTVFFIGLMAVLLISCKKYQPKIYDTELHTMYFNDVPLSANYNDMINSLTEQGFVLGTLYSNELDSVAAMLDMMTEELGGITEDVNDTKLELPHICDHYTKNCTPEEVEKLTYGIVTTKDSITPVEVFVSWYESGDIRTVYCEVGSSSVQLNDHNAIFAPLFSNKQKNYCGDDVYSDNYGNSIEFSKSSVKLQLTRE